MQDLFNHMAQQSKVQSNKSGDRNMDKNFVRMPASTVTGSITTITFNTSAYAATDDGYSVYISPKVRESVGADVGDRVRMIVVDNYADRIDEVRYRAIRITILKTLEQIMADGEEVTLSLPASEDVYAEVPAPKEEQVITREVARQKIAQIMADGSAHNSGSMFEKIFNMKGGVDVELVGVHRKNYDALMRTAEAMHKDGELVLCSMFSSPDQTKASCNYYAKSLAALKALMNGGVNAE
jgi:hypothetical protein